MAAKAKFEQNRLKMPSKDKTQNLMEIDLPAIEKVEEKPLDEKEIEAVKVITIDGR